MTRISPVHLGRIVLSVLAGFAFSTVPIQLTLATGSPTSSEEESEVKNPAHVIREAKVECITPDGKVVTVPSASERGQSNPALIVNDDTIHCPLQEGETTFILSFLKTAQLDRFTFVNENADVQGDMRIAVSNCQLPANSPKWSEVSGKTEFTSKRLLNLSMVGVEARYVRVSFRVEKGRPIASLGRFDGIVP